uniref:Suppressor of white apricot N-terminal domain-containing protein n=2 Tax=Photinus pyralis TaxID=7054 RepID=A0A1Y1K597_PHOPY
MWHEARKQERKIRGMMVDYRRRAERRRDFYEKIKADPTQFLQLHGRQCKIHLDPAVASAADSTAAMMPWQGEMDNLIDRFDVRAHLDYIPPIKKVEDEELTYEERQTNYESNCIWKSSSAIQSQNRKRRSRAVWLSVLITKTRQLIPRKVQLETPRKIQMIIRIAISMSICTLTYPRWTSFKRTK